MSISFIMFYYVISALIKYSLIIIKATLTCISGGNRSSLNLSLAGVIISLKSHLHILFINYIFSFSFYGEDLNNPIKALNRWTLDKLSLFYTLHPFEFI